MLPLLLLSAMHRPAGTCSGTQSRTHPLAHALQSSTDLHRRLRDGHAARERFQLLVGLRHAIPADTAMPRFA